MAVLLANHRRQAIRFGYFQCGPRKFGQSKATKGLGEGLDGGAASDRSRYRSNGRYGRSTCRTQCVFRSFCRCYFGQIGSDRVRSLLSDQQKTQKCQRASAIRVSKRRDRV